MGDNVLSYFDKLSIAEAIFLYVDLALFLLLKYLYPCYFKIQDSAGIPEQIMVIVTSLFKGTTLNKKSRLEHESLRYPETRILMYHGYWLYESYLIGIVYAVRSSHLAYSALGK